MATESSNPEAANRDEWLERKVFRNGVVFRGIRYNCDELMKLRERRLSPRVAVILDRPNASSILVREQRKKSILSVPAVSPLALRASKENSLKRVETLVAASSDFGRPLRERVYGPVVLGICYDAIAEIYMSAVRATVQATLDLATYRAYVEQIRLDREYERNPGMFPERPILKPPNRSLIRRLIAEIPEFDRNAARFGHSPAMVHFRSKKSKVRDDLDEHRRKRSR